MVSATGEMAFPFCLSTSVEKVPSSVSAGDARQQIVRGWIVRIVQCYAYLLARSVLRSVRSMKGVSLDAQSSKSNRSLYASATAQAYHIGTSD